jgi:VIT1/CCC1 family predicted Fe2+/Mn2+ transporter
VLSIFSARGPLLSGARMLGIGLLVSAITYSVGWLFGVSVGGVRPRLRLLALI